MIAATQAKLGTWTDSELDIIAAAYLDMLAREHRAQAFNKSAIRREGLAAMAATREDGAQRSAGSWEMKCCNVSAVARAAGFGFVNGYKPLGHGQGKPIAAALERRALAVGWCDEDIEALQEAQR
jgi:hypothetical protein